MNSPSAAPNPRRWLALALLGTEGFQAAFLVAAGLGLLGLLAALALLPRSTAAGAPAPAHAELAADRVE
jgi:predicted MFS family arabinose efflux permease